MIVCILQQTMKEQVKPSSAQRNAFREFRVIFFIYKNLLVNLLTGFPASSNHCRCTVVYSAIQPTVLGFQRPKKNQEIMIFTAKNKTYLHVAVEVEAFQRNQRN